jgi:hypothetical protein
VNRVYGHFGESSDGKLIIFKMVDLYWKLVNIFHISVRLRLKSKCSSPGASGGLDSWGELTNQSRRVMCPTSVATWSSSIFEGSNFPTTWNKFMKRVGGWYLQRLGLALRRGFSGSGRPLWGSAHEAHTVISEGMILSRCRLRSRNSNCSIVVNSFS